MRPEIRRAAALVSAGVLLAIACGLAGWWQWDRHTTRSAAIAVIEANYSADPVPLSEVLSPSSAPLADGNVWRQVRIQGTYVDEATVLLRNRPVSGQPGYHVLTPLRTSAGVMVIDRGWIPAARADEAVTAPSPPPGEVIVVAHLRADEPPDTRSAPPGQVQRINTAQVLIAGGLEDPGTVVGAYGALRTETPPPATVLGALPAPSTDPGAHLSYAFQWWTFAVGALIGFVVLARRELSGDAGTDASDPDPTDPRPRAGAGARSVAVTGAPRARRRSAEDEEDALIDAQLP